MNERATIPDRGQRYEVRFRLLDDVGVGSGLFLTFAGDLATARAAKKTWSRNDTVATIWIVDRETGKRVN